MRWKDLSEWRRVIPVARDAQLSFCCHSGTVTTTRPTCRALLYVDADMHRDMVEVFTYLYTNNYQLESLVAQSELQAVIDGWGPVFRPDLWPQAAG